MKTFEFEINEKTYQTGKMTPALMAATARVGVLLQREIRLTGADETEAPAVVMAIIFEQLPEIMWNSLSAETKESIGTKDIFFEGLGEKPSLIVEFQQWANEAITKTNDFLPKQGAEKKAKRPQ